MQKIFIFILSITLFSFSPTQSFQRFKAKILTRTFHKGKTANNKGEIAYLLSGKMITKFMSPKEYYIVNTAKGEISIYDPHKNEVFQQQDFQYSTENTQLYFFLQNKKSDLGLKSMGFTVINTRFEQDFMITTWSPPIQASNVLKEVELVHKGLNPVFMSYKDAKNRITKKSYYYNYMNLKGIEFPQAITQIDYPVAGDSIVSKTTYSEAAVNAEANSPLFDFTIPQNAKLLNNAKK